MSLRTLKILVIGDGDAGKTSLRSRYMSREFRPAYRATIGADFASKTIEVMVPSPGHEHRRRGSRSANATTSTSASGAATSTSEGSTSEADGRKQSRTERMRVTLSIWDTAGQERFKSLGTAFYRGADAVIIAFDVTKRGGLARAKTWYKDFCSMGDLGSEEDDVDLWQTNPRQARDLREKRRKFCWVAVGCKGDLLKDVRQSSANVDDGIFTGTTWQEARDFFDDCLPRYLPEGVSDDSPYKNVGAAKKEGNGAAKSAPYDIDIPAPAPPEDVLSRPSPHSNPFLIAEDGNLEDIDNHKERSRHPRAGTPPGVVAQDVTISPKKPVENLEHSVRNESPGKSLSFKYGKHSLAPAQSSLYRSRYDSATSLGAPSVYYSIRGESTVFNLSSKVTSTSGQGSTNNTLRDDRRSQSHDRREDIRISDVDLQLGSVSHDTEIARRRGRSRTGHSGSTMTPKRAKEGDASGDARAEARAGRESLPVMSVVPSGEPIPFPSEDDDLDHRRLTQTAHDLHRRLKRISRPSISQPKDEQNGKGARSRRLSQFSNDPDAPHVMGDFQKDTQEDMGASKAHNRLTLYSATPSSCASTIRAADEGVPPEAADDPEETPTNEEGQSPAVVPDIASSPPSSVHDSEYEADEGELFEATHVEQGFRLFYTSAKDGVGIDDVFAHIARRVAINWAYDEWDEARRRRLWGYSADGDIRTAPPADEERERERVRRAIKISEGKGTGDCCW